jgi:hypothetical protein
MSFRPVSLTEVSVHVYDVLDYVSLLFLLIVFDTAFGVSSTYLSSHGPRSIYSTSTAFTSQEASLVILLIAPIWFQSGILHGMLCPRSRVRRYPCRMVQSLFR